MKIFFLVFFLDEYVAMEEIIEKQGICFKKSFIHALLGVILLKFKSYCDTNLLYHYPQQRNEGSQPNKRRAQSVLNNGRHKFTVGEGNLLEVREYQGYLGYIQHHSINVTFTWVEKALREKGRKEKEWAKKSINWTQQIPKFFNSGTRQGEIEKRENSTNSSEKLQQLTAELKLDPKQECSRKPEPIEQKTIALYGIHQNSAEMNNFILTEELNQELPEEQEVKEEDQGLGQQELTEDFGVSVVVISGYNRLDQMKHTIQKTNLQRTKGKLEDDKNLKKETTGSNLVPKNTQRHRHKGRSQVTQNPTRLIRQVERKKNHQMAGTAMEDNREVQDQKQEIRTTTQGLAQQGLNVPQELEKKKEPQEGDKTGESDPGD